MKHHWKKTFKKCFLACERSIVATVVTIKTAAVSKMATQPKKVYCVLQFHSRRSVITVQQVFREFPKNLPCVN